MIKGIYVRRSIVGFENKVIENVGDRVEWWMKGYINEKEKDVI